MILYNINFCNCGCWDELEIFDKYNRPRKYIHGHNSKGDKNLSKRLDVRKKISIAKRKYTFTKEHKRNISESLKGKKLSENNRLALVAANTGRECPKEVRQKISNTLMGHEVSEETRRKNSLIHKGKKYSEERKEQYRKISKKVWDSYTEEQKITRLNKMHINNVFPNKPESFLLSLLNWLYPNQFKYTGDFSFIINGKNPDFVNYEQKLVIEHFGDYFHKGEDPELRKEIFAQEGWDTLVIWESELKDNLDELIYKIKSFTGAYWYE